MVRCRVVLSAGWPPQVYYVYGTTYDCYYYLGYLTSRMGRSSRKETGNAQKTRSARRMNDQTELFSKASWVGARTFFFSFFFSLAWPSSQPFPNATCGPCLWVLRGKADGRGRRRGHQQANLQLAGVAGRSDKIEGQKLREDKR